MNGTNVILTIILDLFLLFCAAFPLLAFMLWIDPYQRGYFSNDVSLMLPYKEETISTVLIAGVGFAIGVIVIIITEAILRTAKKSQEERFLCGKPFPIWIWRSYCTIGIFVFGAVCQQMTTTIGKYALGRLRPHFFDLCDPVPENPTAVFIEQYTCTPNELQDDYKLQQMLLSFPSAHASFSMYIAVFLVFYIHLNWRWRGSKLLRHFVQLAAILSSWYVGLSRITDHMHHWDDVAVGFLIGILYGVLVYVFIMKPKKNDGGRCRPSAFENGITTNHDDVESRLPRVNLVSQYRQ